jgi:5-methyltetrahydropteroyltriglutamate--homocysteine methyltransferase
MSARVSERSDPHGPLAITVIGSYPQPAWLIDRQRLLTSLPARVRARELWRPGPDELEEAQDDATRLAVDDMERAGIEILTDGEMRRESYSNRFATALEGIDLERPGVFVERVGRENYVPRIVGPIRRAGPIEASDVVFLRSVTQRPIKATLPGPFTMSQQAKNEHYGDPEALAMAFAAVVREEIADLFAAGADVVQIDEPYIQARPEAARRFALRAIDAALQDAPGPTVLHMCFGYGHFVKDKPAGYSFLAEFEQCAVDRIAIEAAQPGLDLETLRDLGTKPVILGVIANDSDEVEPVELVVGRIRAALEVLPPERLAVSPDCGMKYISRQAAAAKLRALAEGARRVRVELGLPA